MYKYRLVRNLLCAGVFIFSPALVRAADAQMQRCLGIADSLKRLDCFEKLARSRNDTDVITAPASQPAAATPKAGIRAPQQPAVISPPRQGMTQVVPGKSDIERWQVAVAVDPIQGGAQVTLRNKAVKGRNQYAVPVELRLQCKRGQAEAWLLWREPMVKGEVPVLLFDGKNVGVASEDWRMDDKGENWRYVGDFAHLMTALSSHAEASARVQVMEENIGFEDDVINAWFNLAGAKFALNPLKKACF